MADILVTAGWQQYPAAVIMLWGVALFWRGLVGGRNGARGLVRRGVPMLDRLEGWRLFLLGLPLTSIGAARYWDALWLLVLSLGFAYVELQESTNVIKAWRWGDARRATVDSQSAGQPISGRRVR